MKLIGLLIYGINSDFITTIDHSREFSTIQPVYLKMRKAAFRHNQKYWRGKRKRKEECKEEYKCIQIHVSTTHKNCI